jgi:hypothetical protein
MFLDFLITTWIFWPLALGLFVLFAALSENDKGPFAGVVAAVILTGFQLFSNYQPLTYIVHNPLESLWGVGAYLLVGFVYMYVKWSFVSHKAAAWYKANPTEGNNYGYSYNGGRKQVPFDVSQWRSELLTWFTFWPASGAWTLLNDPIRIVFDKVYVWSSKRLQSISDSFFKV